MVGSGAAGGDARSKEAMGMMALHEALRNVCMTSDWAYSVFWTIRPRPRCRGGNGCKVGDDNGSLMLMWEDGYCRGGEGEEMEDPDPDPVRKAFSKMSIQLYNYGEGLMGKVASDKCHKWVFKEPSDCEPNISNYWQSSFDALPPEWTDQFSSGVQTIAVIQAGHGLLQLGSCKIIPEDLHFVLRMRHMFETIGYQSGFYLSQLFSSTRSPSPAPLIPPTKHVSSRAPPPMFHWNHQPMAGISSYNHSMDAVNFHSIRMPSSSIPGQKNEEAHNLYMDEMVPDEHDADLKWPNGLSFFTALTGRQDDAKLLFGVDMAIDAGKSALHIDEAKPHANGKNADETEDYLGLSGRSSKPGKDNSSSNFKRSFTLPARMASSSSSSSLDHHGQQQQQGIQYRGNPEAGIYSDIMETFLE